MDEVKNDNGDDGRRKGCNFWSKFGCVVFGFLLCAGSMAVGALLIHTAGWTSKLAKFFGYQKIVKPQRTSGFIFVILLHFIFFILSLSRILLKHRRLDRKDEVDKSMSSTTKFNDVKGVDEAKVELQEIVHYLRDPKKFNRFGGKLPKGVLLVGPPGTGKTMLARAIAGEAGVPIFCRSGNEFDQRLVGVGAERVRNLFNAARAKKPSPCLIFIDEIDSVGRSRDRSIYNHPTLTLNQLLTELDGFKQTDQAIIVIGATNFPELLDKALVRPGRFDRIIVVPNPDVKGRIEIMASHMSSIPKASDVELGIIGKGTQGFSGADLANLVNIAAIKASVDGSESVAMADLEYAKDKIIMGSERKSAVISEKSRKITAYHEGGHAIVALYTNGTYPVHKATIVPRGNALGMVSQLPGDETNTSRRELLAMLDVAMGGRVAEEMIFGEDEVTTGARSDFQKATSLAIDMVTKYGMSSKIGFVTYKDEGGRKSMSKETRVLVEDEVKNLLDKAYRNAKITLEDHTDELHKLANNLLERRHSQEMKSKISLLLALPSSVRRISRNRRLKRRDKVGV